MSSACASKIPTLKGPRGNSPPKVQPSSNERRVSPPRRKESSKIPTTINSSSPSTPRERPQSIDIEDEFKNILQFQKLQQISTPKNGNEVRTSPSRIPVSSSRKSSLDSSPSRTPNNGSTLELDEESQRLIPVDDRSSAGSSPSKSRIPKRSASPPKVQPSSNFGFNAERKVSSSSSPSKAIQHSSSFGWSPTSPSSQQQQSVTDATSPSKSQLPFSTLKESKLNHSNSSSGNSLNRMHNSSASSPSSVSSGTSTSRSQRSGSSGAATDSATEQLIKNDDKIESRSRKKQYEAFVMTGDRMINLAKTPANSEFLSKTTNFRASGGLEKVQYDDDQDLLDDQDETASASTNVFVEKDRDHMHKSSSSGDNLKQDDKNRKIEGSNARMQSSDHQPLLAENSQELASPQQPASSSTNKKSSQRKSSMKKQRQASVDSSPGGSRRNTQSPDLSTSSLISSEHYNGESLLDQDNLSPRSSSSPDTPEWSLIDSYHKQKSNEAKQPLLPIASDDDDERQLSAGNDEDIGGVPSNIDHSPEEAIISEGNRVIITIGNSASSLASSEDLSEGPASSKPNHSLISSLQSPVTSTTTITPNFPSQPIYDECFLSNSKSNNSNGATTTTTNFPSLNTSTDSSEESDLESLRSFHPPPKAIDVPSALRLAKRLYHLDGFKRTDVSRHLGKNNEFSQVVAEEYLRYFNFTGSMSLDMALRCFLQQFCLTGETQERERVLLHFSRRYLECNPEFIENPHQMLYRSLDAVHTLSCAILLLNTDLHGESVAMQRKMSCNEFIENLSELNDGENFPRDLLRAIYYAIKDSPLPWATVEEDEPSQQQPGQVNQTTFEPISKVVASVSDYPKTLAAGDESVQAINSEAPKSAATNLSIGQTGGGINPFLTLPDPTLAVDYKKGYVMRKCCLDPQGKKTKLGKRSWRMFFVTLRDMVLFCFKDEKSLRQPGAYEDFSAAIRIHHGLAVRASDYVKKQFVFRLHTADQAEYLFQTSDEKELLTWIDAINYVVASFSARVLGTPCSSGGRFQRPLLPSSKSTLNMSDQLACHESQLQSLRRDIEDHLQNPPPKHAKANVWQNYKEKQEFLKFEIMRYETYILTLRTKNALDT